MQLKLEDLSIGYKGNKVLCSSISAVADTQQAIALIGSNGEGKSTLLRTLASIQKPLAGRVLIDDVAVQSIPFVQRAQLISFVSTEPISVAYTTVRQVVELGRVPFSSWTGRLSDGDRAIVDEAMELTDTVKFSNRTLDTLSDGQRQRVMIARALAQSTPIMLLDEPTAFLDPENRLKVIEMLGRLARDTNKIIVYSTHEVDLAERYCTRIWTMQGGQLKQKTINICQ